MKRDWLWIAAGIALGEVCGYAVGSVTGIAIITAIIGVLLLFFRRFDRRRAIMIVGVAFLCGLLRMGLDDFTYSRTTELNLLSGAAASELSRSYMQSAKYAELPATSVSAEKTAPPGSAKLPDTDASEQTSESFEARINAIVEKEDRVVLTCGQLLVYADPGEYAIGNTVRIEGSFAPMDTARNPGEFDYRLYYRSLGITHRCFAKKIQVTDSRISRPGQFFFEIRRALSRRMNEIFPENDAAFLRAALLGDKTGLDDDMYEMYRRNGIAHLLAISGLHVAILGMGFYSFLRRLGLSCLSSGILSTVWLIAYALLTGGSVSILRAVIMLVMIFLSGCLGRKNDILNSAGLAASALMLVQPYHIFSCGFLLSFGAVAAIGGPAATICKRLHLTPEEQDSRPEKMLKKLAETLVVSLSIQLVTLPVMAYFFFEIPLYGILLNLVVIPLMTYVVISGLLSLITVLAAGPVHYILSLYSLLCTFFEKLPGHTILIGRPSLCQIALYYCCFFAVLYLFPFLGKKRASLSSMWGRVTAFISRHKRRKS